MSCSTSTAPPSLPEATAAARATKVRDASRESVSSRLAMGSRAQRRAEQRRDVGMADHLHVGPSGGLLGDAQHVLRGAVDELHLALAIDDQHALDHAGEDGFGAGAVARQIVDAASELLRRAVERPRHGAELVLAVVVRRPAEVAGGIPLRHRGDGFDAPRERRREEPRQHQRGHERGAERQRRGAADRGQLRVDVESGSARRTNFTTG